MTTRKQTSLSAPKTAHIRHDLSWEEKREIAYEIFDRISHGEMLRDICSEEGMPHPNTLRNWAYHDTPLATFYACAQKLRVDHLLTELIDLTDAPAPTCKDSRGNVRVDNAAVALMKHRFEAKRWIFTVIRSERSWKDERDAVLTHYPDRPMSPPRTPEPPVHSRVERDSLSASSGQPEVAAPEGAGKNSELTSAVASEAPASESANPEPKTRNSEPSAAPTLPVHKKSKLEASAGEPPATPSSQPDLEPQTVTIEPSTPQTVHKISEPSVEITASKATCELNAEHEPSGTRQTSSQLRGSPQGQGGSPDQTKNPEQSASTSPTSPQLPDSIQRQLAAASQPLRFRRR